MRLLAAGARYQDQEEMPAKACEDLMAGEFTDIVKYQDRIAGDLSDDLLGLVRDLILLRNQAVLSQVFDAGADVLIVDIDLDHFSLDLASFLAGEILGEAGPAHPESSRDEADERAFLLPIPGEYVSQVGQRVLSSTNRSVPLVDMPRNFTFASSKGGTCCADFYRSGSPGRGSSGRSKGSGTCRAVQNCLARSSGRLLIASTGVSVNDSTPSAGEWLRTTATTRSSGVTTTAPDIPAHWLTSWSRSPLRTCLSLIS